MENVASRPRFLDREVAPTVPPRETPVSPRSKYAARQLLFLVTAGAVTAAVAAVVFTVGVYLINRRMTNRDETRGTFCCPIQAAELNEYVNTSIKPCKNFFAYVCSNVIRYGYSNLRERDAELLHALATGLIPKGTETHDAGRFLMAYYKSCVGTIPQRELFLTTLASAFIRKAWQSPGEFDTRIAFSYIMTVSFKYSLPSVISVVFVPYKSAIVLKFIPICNVSGTPYDAVAATTSVLKEYVKATQIEPRAVTNLVQEVCTRLSGALGHEKRYTTRATYAMPAQREAFNREVWDIDDFEVCLSSVNNLRQHVKFVEILNVWAIRLIHDLSAAATNDADSDSIAKMTAFLVSQSVARAAVRFYKAYDASHRLLFDACMASVRNMPNAWYKFTSEVFTTREKDAEAMAMFTFVKNAVHSDCMNNSLFDAGDADRLKAFFKKLSLVTPSNASMVTVPVPSPIFAENLLRGRAYNFEVTRERQQSEHDAGVVPYATLQFVGEARLLLPAAMYGYIYTGPGNNLVPNAALLGRIMAEGLWLMVLYGLEWKAKTLANIDRFKECFKRYYLGGNSTDSPKTVEAFTISALGLSSVTSALKGPDWHTARVAWGTWRLSNAQIFYIFGSHHRCPRVASSFMERFINLPPTYVEDFAMAFQCPSGAPMMKPPRCLLRDKSLSS